jgi:transcriptional regulator with PAS, ATPase and Fis domain
VLLLGSPGVGKELVANALHRSSPRHDNELRRYPLTVNMAALDKNLIEDELFGHDRGAFTGAQEERAGILEAAQRSTVLLDEIGELDQDTQTKLLRAIEYRRVKRIGSSRETEVDIRIIATTNRSIQDLQSRFRPDFYARLAQHCIPVPSLRERWLDAPELVVQQDINEIFDYVIDQMNRDPRHKRALTIEAAAAGFMRQLIHQYINHVNDIFDGNLRALRNIIERAYERAQYDASPEITLGHIIPPLGIVRMLNIKPEAHLRTQATIEQLVGSLNLAAIERKAIVEALTKTGRNHSQAAQLLGVHRDTLRRKVTEYGID